MALVYEKAGTLSAVGARSADLLEKSMNEYITIQTETPMHMEPFFLKHSPTTANFKFTTLGNELDFPRLRNDLQPFPLSVPPPGYSSDWDFLTYQNGVASTKALEQFDRSNELAFIMSGLPKSFKQFYEYGMTTTFELAATATGADGVAGFSGSHPLRGLGAGTWDNDETSAVLSSTSVNSMWVSMANRKDALGFAMQMRLKEIVAGTYWREKLVQLAGSEHVPESNVNATNAWKGTQYTIVETLSSTAPWYGRGSLPIQQSGFHLIEWNAPTITGLGTDTSFPLVTKRWHGYCRVEFGMSIPMNFHRNAGA